LADVFISGTAAIEGHETVAPDDTAGQIERTVRNLRLISKTCGLDGDLGAKRGGERHFKVYIRRANELAQIKAALEQTLLMPADRVSYLRSDICRAELTLEIEATLMGVRVG
jgi:enamine deaminase RidA (YjgF/YER057c/UK114 family)